MESIHIVSALPPNGISGAAVIRLGCQNPTLVDDNYRATPGLVSATHCGLMPPKTSLVACEVRRLLSYESHHL